MNRRLVALLMCVLGATTWTGCAQVRALISPRAAEHTLPVSEGYVTAADGVQLFYRAVGSGGDTVLVLHGGPGVHSGYLIGMEPLAAGGTLIFYDQRGGGRSSLVSHPSQSTVQRHLADLDEIRRHFGISRAVLLGHSWGAVLAALYAAERPESVRGLILAGVPPLVFPGDPVESVWTNRLAAGFGVDWNTMWDTAGAPVDLCRQFAGAFIRGLGTDTANVVRLTEGACDVHPDVLRRGWTTTPVWTMQSLTVRDLGPLVERATAPALVIVGARDPIGTADVAREWVSKLRGARAETLADAGHYMYADQPERFAAVVREFLGRD